jgi:serine/threonine protein kinase
MSLSAGARLGPYEIIQPIGAGGMGEVYRAHDIRLHRDVALKVLPRDVNGDHSRKARFEHEAWALAALNHPNVVDIYDVGTEGGVSYFVSELIEGEPLRGKMPIATAVDTTRQIASGLAAAHSAGVVHRDLKPSNILRDHDGRVRSWTLAWRRSATAFLTHTTRPRR